MAEKKKAYRRFEELTRKAMGPTAEAERTGVGSSSAEELTIRLSPEVGRALKQRAVAGDTTPSELVEEALRRYLDVPR